MSAPLDRSLRARPLAGLAVALTAVGALSAPAQAAPARTVVVSSLSGSAAGVAAAVRHAGGTVRRTLSLVPGVVASLPAGVSVPGFVVAEDRPLAPTGRASGKGRPSTVRETLGAARGTGAGVTVAVVDTGVADVPELAGRVDHVDVTGDGVGDGYGHGTFVAGLVAGTTVGVAPEARVLDVRVGHDDGSTSLSEVLAGLEVVAAHPEVDVLNVSLSSESPLPWQVDPLTVALDALWSRGVLVVVPAGNDGPERGTVASPGIDPTLLTVGGLDEAGTAVRTDDVVPDWSGRGGKGPAKPDLVAPGTHVVSAMAPGSVVWEANPASQREGGLFVGSGTSFSAAVTAGAAAVVLGARPGLGPDRVKSLLQRTAYGVSGPRAATGSGGLDLARALVARAPKASPSTGRAGDLVDLDDVEWDANAWAANAWAARQWSARQWSARQWSARQWSARAWE